MLCIKQVFNKKVDLKKHMPVHLKKKKKKRTTEPIEAESNVEDQVINQDSIIQCFVRLNRVNYLETAVEKGFKSVLITRLHNDMSYTPIP